MAKKKRRSRERLLRSPDCHVGIVGGGLAGLSAALAMLRRGRTGGDGSEGDDGEGSRRADDAGHGFRGRITIYERDLSPSDRKEGYGMTITYDPSGPLAELGVLERVARRDCPSRCHYLFDENGNVRGYFGNAFYDDDADGIGSGETNGGRSARRGAGQRGNLRIPRSELRAILMEELLSEASSASNGGDSDGDCKVEISWNKRLVSYEDGPMMEKLDQTHRGNGKKKVQQKHDEEAKQQSEQPLERPVLLHFEDGTTDSADLLIGADGVNSVVAKQYLSTSISSLGKGTSHERGGDSRDTSQLSSSTALQSESAVEATICSPRHVGVFVILGISDHYHPLVDERGFYTLDGEHRLFVMPFQGSRLDDEIATEASSAPDAGNSGSDNGNATTPAGTQSASTPAGAPTTSDMQQNRRVRKRRRTMWQLSFPVSKEDSSRLCRLSSKEMKEEVLRRCGHWHEPFPSMVKDTPLDTIWGTSLLDRDPNVFLEHRKSLEVHGRVPSRVVILGDAAHSMTPFKGQGANQALADGPLLAKWLSKSNVDSAVRGFATEMARRSGVKVRASREAALKLHSKECWEWMAGQDGRPTTGVDDIRAVFHGVKDEHVSRLLKTLRERGVVASLGSKLDGTIRDIVRELDVGDAIPSANNKIPSEVLHDLRSQALEHSSTDNLSQLRRLSRISHLIIPNALDTNKRTCLHLAAMNGHVDTCRWLVAEVSIDCDALDANGKKAVYLASDAGHDEAARLLQGWMDRMIVGRSCETDVVGVVTAAKTCPEAVKSQSEQSNCAEKDAYRLVEQQLRGIRTIKQLRTLLHDNRAPGRPESSVHAVTHVLGCHLDESDEAHDIRRMEALAKEHGAVLLRNFVAREADQLALGALALRPMKFDLSRALDEIRPGMNDGCFEIVTKVGSRESVPKSQKKRVGKRIEDVKSHLTIAAHAGVTVQTNFGPQLQSNSSNESAPKKRRMDAFPLSRLRYINLGDWNYNWGERRYERVAGAMPLPDRLIALARRAHDLARYQTNEISTTPVSFDMAICNLYHLQRPSDRLGGHRDNVESNLTLPLVTISLGAPGIFLLGRESREKVPTAILLRGGDCMIMSGKSRGYFHGVPTILEPNDFNNQDAAADATSSFDPVFPELNQDGRLMNSSENDGIMTDGTACGDVPSLDEMRFVKAFLGTVRMNMSIRQV